VVKTLPLALTVSKGEKKMISITLEEIVEKAEKARVNGEDEGFEINKKDIETISKFKNIDEFLSYGEAAHWLYWYAENVIKGRWPEAEEYIMKNPYYAYYYAKNIIKDRWLEAEEYIMKDPKWAYWYALYVIKDRWLEAEEYIMKIQKRHIGML